MLAFFALGPLVIYPVFLMKVMCFALFACAFNLLLGYVGLLSFGHAMFLGMAGYTAAHAAKVWGLTPELAILAGAGAACVPRHRFRTDRDPAPGHLFRDDHARARADGLLLLRAGAVHPRRGRHTGGAARQALRHHGSVGHEGDVRSRCSSIFLAGFLLIYRVIHSPFGQVLKAIRENEARALSLGYDVDRYKLLAYVLSATLSGVAGATNALVFQLAALNAVHWTMSGEVVLMTLVGGMGTVFGPVAGALVVLAMENYLAQLGSWVTIVQGVHLRRVRADVPPRHRRRAGAPAPEKSLELRPQYGPPFRRSRACGRMAALSVHIQRPP